MASKFISAYTDIYRELHQPVLITAGCFAAIAVILSIYLILQHLRSYTNPAIISLCFPRLSLACDILRNCYEAFALYSFGSYLVACLGGERRVIELLENKSRKELGKPLLEGADENRPVEQISFRNFFFRPRTLGKDLLVIEKFGLVQYMAIAAIAHVYVFSAEPYRFLPLSEYGKVTTETTKEAVKLEQGHDEKPAVLQSTETKAEAPGTSVRESVQEIVLEGGQHVVKDVVLTFNQAIGPVEKGVTKIQETFHQKSVGSDDQDVEEESELKVEQHVEANLGES
ncbi:hypothetical protein FH972_002969 [Carpinus fangiana]|uniref:Uncharacterized protein n=1 Tax=Carpinus fangiana TaxID=176857 RepID=A0A5N6QJ65_9ROSI|nr:hypothetical protein FH972_002969 [Carpinus fangiana]